MLLFFVKMFVLITIGTMVGVIIIIVMFQKSNIVSIIKKGVAKMTEKRLTKLCKTYGEYLCSYCTYRQPLGHCRYYKGSYTLKGDLE